MTIARCMICLAIMELNKQKIILEMERLGWNQSELARRMNAQRQVVNRYLADGERGISLKMIARFADALGIPAKDLIK